ncbi:S8 family peptidase [Allorhizocola rhizosphaerae]|uniref:S8 family peptidase n=1 Tax=Allorhizocola rhizosphaerae TaxID=1872709 RepID=UPI001FEBF2ED|nr:S8 family peptidase [Allorhizocola rhizosphaerae]
MKALLVLALAFTGAPATEDPSSYIVVLDRGVTTAHMPGKVERTFTHALHGYEVTMTPSAARRLAAQPGIASVEPNLTVHIGPLATQPNPPSWGLDRIDQRNLPLDKSYTAPNNASNVHAYILSTGIRTTHTDFGGRAIHGRDTVDNDNDATDCHGHGTFMAGVVGGANHGVAKGVNLVAMRILNCQGSATYAQVIAGVDWVTANARRPAVAFLPVGGGANNAVDTAVRNSIASGVSYVLSSGSGDSCTSSPGRVTEGITVDGSNASDAVMPSSASGSCIDLFAPGMSITSTWWTTDAATNTISGGSPAGAHAAGVAALIVSANPTWTAAQVHARIVADATPGVLTSVPPGAPNRLLYVKNGACDGTQNVNVNIPDHPGAAVFSDVVIGCAGVAQAASRVEVHIVHTFVGDLTVDLVAPDGSVYRLHNRTGGSVDNIHQTYVVNLSAEARLGTWRLRAQDHAGSDVGYIDSWTVTL